MSGTTVCRENVLAWRILTNVPVGRIMPANSAHVRFRIPSYLFIYFRMHNLNFKHLLIEFIKLLGHESWSGIHSGKIRSELCAISPYSVNRRASHYLNNKKMPEESDFETGDFKKCWIHKSHSGPFPDFPDPFVSTSLLFFF